jgi:hypothetical protein
MDFIDLMRGIDWALLHDQKQWLLQHEGDEADGLIHLIDALEDTFEGFLKKNDQTIVGYLDEAKGLQ